jgi:Uma2 family endonuclease
VGTTIKFTVSDVEALPDRLDDTRYELIDGELHVAHQPHWGHQLVGTVLASALLGWSLESGRGMPNTAPGLIFSPEDGVAPDVLWISHERLAEGLGDDGKLHAAPELVIEILSPGPANEKRDRDLKLKLYAREGVDEYWIVDRIARTIEVFRRADGMLAPAETVNETGVLTSPLLPGFAYPVADLWRLVGR